MSDNERFAVYKSLIAFGAVLITQTIAVAWWAATLQANVQAHDEKIDDFVPRIEMLERDYYRRGGSKQ